MKSLKIGLVYNLREDYMALGYSEEETAEFDTISSLNAMTASLERLGHEVDHVGHGQALAQRLVKGDMWDLVFSMAEGISGRNREAQVPAILELFEQPYVFSDPLTMSVALDKAVAKRLVLEAGIPTPSFKLIQSDQDDLKSWSQFPAFVKPVAEGTSKGCGMDSKIYDLDQLAQSTSRLLIQFQQPVLVEKYLPGREFTVGIVGNGDQAKVLGVAEITMNEAADQEIFSMRNKEDQETLCSFTKVTDGEAEKVAAMGLAAYRCLGCRDLARIDFRSDADGNPHFLEANPIAGLHPKNSDLPILAALHDISYDSLMGMIIGAAASRYDLQVPHAKRAHPRVSFRV